MESIKISNPNNIYLNSFHPLCMSELGIRASEKYSHPYYIEGSCRREPDFENPFPTISAICRQGLFAPRLCLNDVVVYLTVKRRFLQDKEANNKFIAILQVVEILKTHQDAYDWFKTHGLQIPGNCMVDQNPPLAFDHTAGNFDNPKRLRLFLKCDKEHQIAYGRKLNEYWDSDYQSKANKWTMFIRTKPLYIELNNPVSLFKADLITVFGDNIPIIKNPKSITFDQLKKLCLIAGIMIDQ